MTKSILKDSSESLTSVVKSETAADASLGCLEDFPTHTLDKMAASLGKLYVLRVYETSHWKSGKC